MPHSSRLQTSQPQAARFYVLRLLPGADLKKSLLHFCREKNIQSGWIATSVGSLTDVHLRFATRKEGSRQKGHYEILSLSGTVSRHGLHLHLAIADEAGATMGGHLLEDNLVYTTAEIVIGTLPDVTFTREKDGSTAWAELQIDTRN